MVKKNGFMLIESLVTCAIIMVTWYAIIQCAVQAIALEQQIERKIAGISCASTIIEKLRSGAYPLKNNVIILNGLHATITCTKKLCAELLFLVTVTVTHDTQELVCINTAILKG